jgi:glycosyltransferase involved in cell wall biosynthesis
MRILHVTWTLSPHNGGPAKAAIEMCGELARKGHEVALYTTDRDGKGRLEVPLGEPVTGDDGVERRYFSVYGDYSFSMSFAAAIKQAIPRYDLVHVHSLYRFTSTAACHYCRRYGVPYVVQPHGSLDPYIFYHHPVKKRVYERLFERRNLEAAAAVNFTAYEEMELARSLGLRFRGAVAPLGVTLDLDESSVPEGMIQNYWPETSGKRVLLFLGRLNFKKGLDLLVKAFGAIARRRDDVHLLLAGPDDEGYGRRVKQWLKEEGVADRATFTGMLLDEKKAAALKGADIFVLPSYSENFGIAIFEAMASGLPVVLSNKVNFWREIEEAGAGAVVNCDAEELTRTICTLLDDESLRRSIGAGGRRLVAERFTWKVAVERLLDVYREVLARPGMVVAR